MSFQIPYFFVPATKINKLDAIRNLTSLSCILDFEDAVAGVDLKPILEIPQHFKYANDLWCRIPVMAGDQIEMPSYLDILKSWGIKKWVLPKLNKPADFDTIVKYFPREHKFMVLVETPMLFLNMASLLAVHKDRIEAIGLGSHDLMIAMGAEHIGSNLFPVRFQLKMIAAAYEVQAVDIASMNLNDDQAFMDEMQTGQEMGYDSKFLLHPKQLNWYLDFNKGVKSRELAWAERVLSRGGGVLNGEVEAFELDGEIIEKPHLNKAISIINAYKNDIR